MGYLNPGQGVVRDMELERNALFVLVRQDIGEISAISSCMRAPQLASPRIPTSCLYLLLATHSLFLPY